jgi:hypothetical protein
MLYETTGAAAKDSPYRPEFLNCVLQTNDVYDGMSGGQSFPWLCVSLQKEKWLRCVHHLCVYIWYILYI